MGKTTDTQQSKTKYELDAGQQAIRDAVTKKYMPDGTLADGTASVAPFSQDSQDAFAKTRASQGVEQPTFDAAKGYTTAAAGTAGQQLGQAEGWTVGPDGKSTYQDFATGVAKSQNPHEDAVVQRGLKDLEWARGRADLATADSTIQRGSFGGTRQGVREAIDRDTHAKSVERFVAGTRSQGFEGARNQYNIGFGQGTTTAAHNTGIEQADRAAKLASGKQLGDQALQNQAYRGNDINALRGVGQTIEDKDQAARDTAEANKYKGLDVASATASFGTPANSTTDSKKGVTGSSIWGTAAAAGANAAAAYFSDESAKKNVEDADPNDALAEIRKLTPKTYEYTEDARDRVGVPAGRRTGFMAQDLEKATGAPAPEAGGFKQIDVAEHIGRLTQAVQALDEQMRAKYGPRKKAA